MKILVAPDSFKGCLSSEEVCHFIEKGIKKVDSTIEVITVPIADGGEGTSLALVKSTEGTIINTIVHDPLMRKKSSFFGVLGDGKTAVIEMSAASGITLLNDNEKNPLITTTYGTGELIKAALDLNYRNIIIGVGGSATNDGGMGMAMALGVKFFDVENKELAHGGGNLNRLDRIDISYLDPRINECNIIVACDVENPLCGPSGASYIFGRQKGASDEVIEILDSNLKHYGDVVEKTTGILINNLNGAGAAGGLAGGILAFLNAKLKKGIDLLIEISELEKKIQGADYVITGEGMIDYQTSYGKAPLGIAKIAAKYKIPVIAIGGAIGNGANELYKNGFTAIFSIANRPMSLEYSMNNCGDLLESLTESIIRLLIA